MKKQIISLLAIICFCAQVTYAQSRVNREKESFISSIQLLGTVTEWNLNSDEIWHKSESDHYARVITIDATPTRPTGFHKIKLVSFNANNEIVYALAYEIGYWSYRYEYIEVESHRYSSFSYYFLSEEELSQIVNLVDGEISVSFNGYLSHMDEDQDRVIQRFKKGIYTHDGPFVARLRVTDQDGRKVLRFTVPYDHRQKNDNVFDRGPYYEIRFSDFEKIKKKISRVLNQ